MRDLTILLIIFAAFKLKYSYCFQPYQYFDTCSSLSAESDVNILTTLNGKIKGNCLNVPVSYSNGSKITGNVFRWLSIPYAQPPIKENRFKKALPVNSWTNILNGTNWPNRF